jgi:arylsulfatase A-like enzyme
LQRIRDDWTGPANMTNPSSAYLLHLVQNDLVIGTLFQALKDVGVWDNTFFVLGSDHGMGTTSASAHVPSQMSSWNNFLVFYGPGLKKGATIPYAELPDVPVTVMKWFGLPPLKGHTGTVNLAQKGPTGVFLSNLYAGAPADLPSHPRYIDTYLKTDFPTTDDFVPYRNGMIQLIR